MGKYIKKNAEVSTIEDVWLIKDSSGNYHERVQGNMINLVKNADVVGVSFGGGGGGPHWGGVSTYTIDFNAGQSLSVKKGNNTTTLTGYPATCTSNNDVTGMFYVEHSQNEPDLVSYDENEGCYMRPWNIGRFGQYSDEEPGVIAQPDVVRIQKGCTALTSVFPGVTYNGTTVRYNPVELNPYTVELYGDGELIDSWTECDTYFWTYYNDSSTGYGFADYAIADWNEAYNTDYSYIDSIQYSTSTTGDSNWTDIGWYKPFPDNVNVKRVKITLG